VQLFLFHTSKFYQNFFFRQQLFLSPLLMTGSTNTSTQTDWTTCSRYAEAGKHIHYRSKVWGHLEMSLFFKEKHFFQ